MGYLGRIEENNVFSFYSYNSPQPTQLDAKIAQFFSQDQVVLVHTLKSRASVEDVQLSLSACFFSFPRLHSKYETRDCTAKRPLGTKEVSTNIWKRTENESLLMDGTDHEVEAQNIKKRVDMDNRTPKGFKATRSQVRDFSRTVVNQKLLMERCQLIPLLSLLPPPAQAECTPC